MMRIETNSMVISLSAWCRVSHARTDTGQNPPGIGEILWSMARPTARVMALLELLQPGGVRTVTELAGRLGVDERTVRRYVDHLIDLDVPVESVRGRYGGYRLGPGHPFPPLLPTHDEGARVLPGPAAGRRAGLLAGTGTASETATAKIRRVLPERLARRLDALLGSLAFTTPS